MKKIIGIITVLILFVLTILSCEKIELEKDVPDCIESKIRKIKNEEVQNPPTEVWEWKADGMIYYYISSECCDQFNFLYDENCNQVCAPDGGISGGGDGNCPTFNEQIEKTLIWRDDRG
ncbi:hypothetical protein [Marivirga sp.]|uniref:DUF6970 domain-containing protein n=1 Tax=Marivirga sp. TaxID=2018662 RepID=UPI0025EDC41A|nr:hypothetical protein [Marivirga sp.]